MIHTKTRTNQQKKITIDNGKHIQKKRKYKTILYQEKRCKRSFEQKKTVVARTRHHMEFDSTQMVH